MVRHLMLFKLLCFYGYGMFLLYDVIVMLFLCCCYVIVLLLFFYCYGYVILYYFFYVLSYDVMVLLCSVM